MYDLFVYIRQILYFGRNMSGTTWAHSKSTYSRYKIPRKINQLCSMKNAGLQAAAKLELSELIQ